MILIYHIVNLKLWRPAFPDVFTFLGCNAIIMVRAYIINKLVVLQLLAVSISSCPERGSEVKSANAVVNVEVVGDGVAILVHAI